MSATDDGTINLLTNAEAQLIIALGGVGEATPTQLARQLDRARGLVARDAAALAKFGLVKITRLPKQVTYELSGQGQLLVSQIRARTTATGRFLTGADLSTKADRGYDVT